MLYFGYGSNLCGSDLSRWCVERSLKPIALTRVVHAFVPDRRLAFTHRSTTRGGGVLDIPEARGAAVAGVLFRVAGDEAIATLDRKESEGHTYRRIETIALTEDGGEERHPVLARHDASGREAATTTGTLLNLGPYPGLIVDGAKNHVAGELYLASEPDTLFAELDAIETFRGFGVPGSLYRRAIVRVRLANSGAALAWTYIYAGPRSGCRVIDSGDWREPRQP